MGALTQALAESGQLENTVIIFTSDQGFAWGQHGLREKWLPYDAAICAPLIFSAPKLIKPGTVCREPVNGVDVVRTIHFLAGIEREWKMHGRDLSALLMQPEGPLNEPLPMINTARQYGQSVVEHLKSRNDKAFERKGLYAWMMMRDGKYKYIRHFKDNVIEELYGMERDPDELDNLAVNAEYRKTLTKLRRKAVEEFRRKDGGFGDHLPAPKAFQYEPCEEGSLALFPTQSVSAKPVLLSGGFAISIPAVAEEALLGMSTSKMWPDM